MMLLHLSAVVVTVAMYFYVLNEDFHMTWCELMSCTRTEKTDQHIVNGSSVWCTFTEHGKRLCSFKNLYFKPQENLFLFLLNEDSVVSGIGRKEDLKSFDASAVLNHNRFHLQIVPVSADDNIIGRNLSFLDSVFALWRFKMDNIMHVLHDDLLPLYYTYSHICNGDIELCREKYRLFFVDGGGIGTLHEWYKLFSTKEPIQATELKSHDVICFIHCHVGLVSNTLWYQYGFGRPQGPIKNLNLHGHLLLQFSAFIKKKLNLSSVKKSERQKQGVLLSRQINRRILNEMELINSMKQTYNSIFHDESLRIDKLDLSTNDTKTLMSLIHNSDIVIGMHGSAMILCLFVQPGALVIEIFPFGINPDYVSPVKALSKVAGSFFNYFQWVNEKENNSFPNENAHQLHGGISHLSEGEKAYIRSIKEVPAVECCHNTVYLYRMFQDTVVGQEFLALFSKAILKHNSSAHTTSGTKENLIEHWYFPAQVRNLTCVVNNQKIAVKWMTPLNVKTNHKYEITLSSGDWHLSVTAEKTDVLATVPPKAKMKTIQVWVKCIAQGVESSDAYTECSNG
ncbi:protein O-linked-mannose beta-1,4-N-acetylglucosaminyltransferase 2-like [Schistocerca americana]|uniref:protein O-linked-mannose beta-1,4-N-acetylglucosaminyltransferase 2-like n=1 Tax=Schistocerca americana TaxID=7009 RepID=UPI001F4FE7B5|nr:protein O-linked-mannose beta-1,4-N-acetylglucosaminyltransferase 2-like [Schistocerca americana]